MKEPHHIILPGPPLLPPPREALLKEVESKLTSGVDAGNDMFILMAASVFYHEQNFDSALRCLNQSDSLEGWALLHWLNLFSFSILPHFLPLTSSLCPFPLPPLLHPQGCHASSALCGNAQSGPCQVPLHQWSASYQQSLHM